MIRRSRNEMVEVVRLYSESMMDRMRSMRRSVRVMIVVTVRRVDSVMDTRMFVRRSRALRRDWTMVRRAEMVASVRSAALSSR